MEVFASVAMLVTLVVTLVVGGRLLLVARRTRQLPELLFGIGFVAGGLGQGLPQLGQRVLWTQPGPLATGMNTALFAFSLVGTAALYVAIWRIYRPGPTFGAALCGAALPLLLVVYGVRIAQGDFATGHGLGTGMMLFQALRAVLFAWASVEAFRYWGLLRRRLVLGLADPVVANQMLMWGIAGASMVAVNVTISWNLFVVGRTPLVHAGSTAFLLVGMAVVSLTMWCAFFPPRRLRARLTSRVS